MHPVALFIVLSCAAGIYACLHKLRSLRKRLYTTAFDRPTHGTAEEAWAWEVKYNGARAAGFWLWMTMSALFVVFVLALISAVTGATGP